MRVGRLNQQFESSSSSKMSLNCPLFFSRLVGLQKKGYVIGIFVLALSTLAEVQGAPIIGKVFGKKPSVQIERRLKRFDVPFWGKRVATGDKVITNSKGQAQIMLAGGNVIYLASGSSVHLSRKIVEQETYKYDLTLKGKILAKVNRFRNYRIRIKTANAIIGVKGTEFIVEYVKGFTTVGTLKGTVEVTDLKSNKRILINKGQMSLVSASSDLVLTKITNDLYEGLEFSQLVPKPKTSLPGGKVIEKQSIKKEFPLIKVKPKPVVIEKPITSKAGLSFFERTYERYEKDLYWHISTISTLLVSAYLSTLESSSYNTLASDNDSIKTKAATASESEYTTLNTQFEVNQAKMEQYKKNISLYNSITYLSIAFEGYLLFFPPQTATEKNILIPKVSIRNSPTGQKAEILLNWKF